MSKKTKVKKEVVKACWNCNHLDTCRNQKLLAKFIKKAAPSMSNELVPEFAIDILNDRIDLAQYCDYHVE